MFYYKKCQLIIDKLENTEKQKKKNKPPFPHVHLSIDNHCYYLGLHDFRVFYLSYIVWLRKGAELPGSELSIPRSF